MIGQAWPPPIGTSETSTTRSASRIPRGSFCLVRPRSPTRLAMVPAKRWRSTTSGSGFSSRPKGIQPSCTSARPWRFSARPVIARARRPRSNMSARSSARPAVSIRRWCTTRGLPSSRPLSRDTPAVISTSSTSTNSRPTPTRFGRSRGSTRAGEGTIPMPCTRHSLHPSGTAPLRLRGLRPASAAGHRHAGRRTRS